MPDKPITYSELINNLLKDMPDFMVDFVYNTGKSYSTKLEYCRDAGIFLDFMINYLPEHDGKTRKDITLDDLGNVTVLDVQRFIGIYTQEDMPLATAKRKRAAISRMFGYFVNIGKLKENPVAKTDPIRVPKGNLIFLSNEEQKLFLDTIRSGEGLDGDAKKKHYLFVQRDSAMFLLMLDTGLRVSEMLGTDIIDFDLDECSVVVIRKGGDRDTVFFSDECKQYLEEYFLQQRSKFKLRKTQDLKFPAFTTTTGKRLGVRAVEQLVKNYIALSVPTKYKVMTPHKLRSSFAMSYYEASGHDLVKLKEKLHHANIETTNIYARASKSDMKNTRNILQGLR